MTETDLQKLAAARPSEPRPAGAVDREDVRGLQECYDQRLSCAAATPSGAVAYVELATVPADLLKSVLAALSSGPDDGEGAK